MNQTFATIIHAAPKLDCKELMDVRKQLSAVLDDKFVRECDTNYDLINPVVSSTIPFLIFYTCRWPKISISRNLKMEKLFYAW